MLTAVSLLSPVSIHIFIPAFRNACIVSGTPSCRRSSMPVAPQFRQAERLVLLYFQNANAARVTGQDGPLCVSTSQNRHPTGTCLGIPPFQVFLSQSPSHAKLLTHTLVTASGASNSSKDPFKSTFLILMVVSSHSGCGTQTLRLLMTNILHYFHSLLPQTTPKLLSCITLILPISRPTSLFSALLNSLYLLSQGPTTST